MAGSIGGIGPGIGPARVGLEGLTSATSKLQATGPSRSFAETLERALGEVSALQGEARDAIGAFVSGQPVELHEVMAAAEEAGIALEMLIEIRNKVTEAYRSVMQMQS